jgi:hypothetical protein
VVPAVIGALLAFPLDTPASTRMHPPLTATVSTETEEAARVLRYWTPARMRSTPPLDTGRLTPSAGGANPFATVSFIAVADASVPPFAVNGRVFVRRGRDRGSCSGTAINSPTRQLVLTAAHCVNSGPVFRKGNSMWSRFLQFVPAYDDGVAPFGAFVARRHAVYADKQWTRWGNPDFDIGAFQTLPNASGQNVADAVGGGATISIDQPRGQEFETFGYPGEVRSLQQCNSPYLGDDSLSYPLLGPPTMAIRCHWGPGASGGGWLIAGGTMINGLTSYGHRFNRTRTFGPYFASENVGKLVRGL